MRQNSIIKDTNLIKPLMGSESLGFLWLSWR